jgi:hypothetical protein
MRGEYHLNRPGYALHCLNPVDVSDCLGGRVPLIDLACFSDACPAGTGNDTEQDLLQLVDEFLATSSVDFPSSILFYPAELLSRNRA